MNTKINLLIPAIIFLLASLLFISCNQEGRGFALPAGDIASGQATFVKLSCNECHSIDGIEWKGNAENIKVVLGGEVNMLKSYGELVTSVINPSHKISKNYQNYQQVDTSGNKISKMKNYNEVMTVQELVDIVTFLQSKYEIVTPPGYYYPYK